jgi:alkanesulfonate monooxygenase SsuD/methylene tetrahydromethanopterin reductase-like flavin-dependent oxidoreductase (luciferase family)
MNEEAKEISPERSIYSVGLLMVVGCFYYLDRNVLNILIEPIKQDLGVSDSAMGVLTGGAFMDKVVTGPATEHQRRSMERLMDGYDMNLHGDATQLTSAVDDAFADSYVIVGTTSECEKRIRELAALGLDRIVLSHVPQDRPEYGEIQRRVVEELIPAVRGSA